MDKIRVAQIIDADAGKDYYIIIIIIIKNVNIICSKS
jgi:hypothetical protein